MKQRIIDFRLLQEQDLPDLEEWHKEGVSLPGTEWPRKLFAIINNDPCRKCFIASVQEENVGYVDCEFGNDENVYIALMVDPKLRNKGYGKDILQSFMSHPEVLGRIVCAGIEEDHVQSLRCFEAVGFVRRDNQPNHEGIINLTFCPADGQDVRATN